MDLPTELASQPPAQARSLAARFYVDPDMMAVDRRAINM